MATRKNRPVLYEVVRTSRRRSDLGRRHVPSLWRSVSRPAPGDVRTTEPPGVVPEATPRPAFVRVENDRIHLVIRWPVAVAFGAALLVLLTVAFEAGRGLARGRSDAVAAEEMPLEAVLPMTPSPARVEQPAPPSGGEVVTPRRELPGQPVAAEPGAEAAVVGEIEEFRPEKGRSYLVVQHFPQERLSVAREARDFLRAGGVPCVLTRRGRDFVLIASEGFTRDAADARQRRNVEQRMNALMAKVRQLGREFAPRGYTFDRCRFEEVR